MSDADRARRRIEIRRMGRDDMRELMADKGSAYWRGPDAEYMQEMYRARVEMDTAATTLRGENQRKEP
jgi:hypothetical protein